MPHDVPELEKLIYALLMNQVYLGPAFGSGMLNPVRKAYLCEVVTQLANQFPEQLSILEIGSWVGGSAIAIAESLESCGPGRGEILCVDAWEPFIDLPNNPDEHYKRVSDAASSGIAYKLFLHNVRASGFEHLIRHRRGFSREVLPSLKSASYHLIYVDGSHAFEDVALDLRLSMHLVREGGIICGDDLELSFHAVDSDFHAKAVLARIDCIRDPRTGEHYHAGVTEAVHQTFGAVNNYSGFWAVQRKDGMFRSI